MCSKTIASHPRRTEELGLLSRVFTLLGLDSSQSCDANAGAGANVGYRVC